MDKRHWMVDLETLAKQPGAALLSIGAQQFDPASLTLVGDGVHILVDPTTCQRHGLHLDADTVLWWMSQPDEARRIHFNVDEKGRYAGPAGVTLQAALCEFLMAVAPGEDYGNVVIWGNGATFDNVLLREAYNRADIIPPWEFWNDRCYRTIANQFKDVPKVKPEVAHNALHDARAQAQHLLNIVEKHQLKLD